MLGGSSGFRPYVRSAFRHGGRCSAVWDSHSQPLPAPRGCHDLGVRARHSEIDWKWFKAALDLGKNRQPSSTIFEPLR